MYTGLSAPRPSNRQFPAARRAPSTGESTQPEPDAGDDRGARTGAAGERLARAALVDAERDARADRSPACSRRSPAAGSARWPLDQRPLRRDRRAVDVGDHLHGVRIAHRHDHDVRGPAVHVERPDVELACTGGERRRGGEIAQGAGRSCRTARGRARTTARPMSTVTRPSSSSRGAITPRERLDADLALRGEALVAHEPDEAARAVAALLDLAAVGVEDAVAEVDAGRARAARPPGSGRSRRRSAGRRGAAAPPGRARPAARRRRGRRSRCRRRASS